MYLTLIRADPAPDADGIIGFIADDNGKFICNSLELPWLQNQHYVSCIPKGTYALTTGPRQIGGLATFRLLNVPDRTDIDVHVGNYPHDSLGCILVGVGYTLIDTINASLVRSDDAMHRLLALAPTELEIR